MRIFQSLRGRLVLAALTVELVMLALLIGNGVRLVEGYLRGQTTARVHAVQQAYAAALAGPLAARDYATIRDMLDAWRRAPDVRYLGVLDQDMRQVAASGWPAGEALPDALPDPTDNPQSDLRYPVDFLGQRLGYVQFGLDTSFIAAARRELMTQGAMIAGLELILSTLLLTGTGLWLTRHLIALAGASRMIADGEYGVRSGIEGQDEVGELAHNFDRMAQAVEDRMAALSSSEQRFRAIADYTYAWENWFGTDGQLRWVNPAVERITGFRPEECYKLPDFPLALVHPQDVQAVRRRLLEARAGHSGRDMEFRISRKDGQVVWVAMSWQPIFDDKGASLGFRSSIRDITLEHHATEELAFQSSHDTLTGLFNRCALEAELQRLLGEPPETRPLAGLLYIDLDQFKAVNDTCGHAAGDDLLCQLARLMQHKLPAGFLARLGGDEFGLILVGEPLEDVVRKAQRVVDELAAFRFNWHDKVFHVGASVGVAMLGNGLNSVGEVLIAADSACYVAKDRGRNRVVSWKADDPDLAERRAELGTLAEITDALVSKRFMLYQQELLALRPGLPTKTEILIRLRGRDGEIIPPSRFIPAAERYNLMPYVDRWVVESTFRFLAQRREAGLAPPFERISINLSGASLSDTALLPFLREQFALHRVMPGQICFEITETAAVTQLDRALDLLEELRAEGCEMALDDFGSGLSSFAYLKRFSVDTLKIDGMFVKNLEDDATDRAVVESMVCVARAHGLLTVAEFVATPGILEIVRGLGVDYAQGYAAHMPIPLA
ncbi:MAG: EAL domain-containing protein [Zoogloea sp.]|nr:EAL domain-containing protein [Zoogloea sp.]